MTLALFGVSDTPWWLCQPVVIFWPTPWCFKLMTSFVNRPEPKTIIFRIQFISIRVNRICVTKGVQLSLVRPTKACFRWIPSNCWIFHHSSSFLMTLGPSSSAFVSFLSYRWLFNVATSFVNGPLPKILKIEYCEYRFTWMSKLMNTNICCLPISILLSYNDV